MQTLRFKQTFNR